MPSQGMANLTLSQPYSPPLPIHPIPLVRSQSITAEDALHIMRSKKFVEADAEAAVSRDGCFLYSAPTDLAEERHHHRRDAPNQHHGSHHGVTASVTASVTTPVTGSVTGSVTVSGPPPPDRQ